MVARWVISDGPCATGYECFFIAAVHWGCIVGGIIDLYYFTFFYIKSLGDFFTRAVPDVSMLMFLFDPRLAICSMLRRANMRKSFTAAIYTINVHSFSLLLFLYVCAG